MARDYTLARPPATSSARAIDYAAELNPQQLAAATCPPGPALVIAGAGSGKTRTLTYRVAYLLENGVEPRNILLLTFTNKAAREMIQRVEELVGLDPRQLWGGTFHSIGNRLLRRHAAEIGFEPSFTIMDREDQKDLLQTVIAECDIDTKGLRFPKPEVLGDLYSLSVNTGKPLKDVVLRRYPYFDRLLDPILDVHKAYEEKKKATNNMDFDDLLSKTARLLRENPGILEFYQRQFQFLLVDEYQDTNSLQGEFIDLLARDHRNLMVVGDDAQSIYSWRGANFQNILKFPDRYPGAAVYKIETNYRSVPEILRLANETISVNRNQFAKQLQPARPEKENLPALVSLGTPTEQARFVGQRILELREEGIELEEMAVIYRAHFHSMEVQMELTARGIPFQVTSGLRFFEQAHIKDVAAFMKVIVNRRDEISFKRLVRMLPGIGPTHAEGLWRKWMDSPVSDPASGRPSPALLEFKVPSKGRKAWEQLAYTLDELLDEEGKPMPPAEMIPSILGGVYDDYLRGKYPNYDSRKQDLNQLQSYSRGFEEIGEFLSQLSLLTGVDNGNTPSQEPDREAVCLTSVHQAKGLEWRVVFLIWLADGMFPNARVLEEEDADGGLEEERRLFYVAVTRAKDELYLTYPSLWPGSHNGDVLQRPSRFLKDFPKELVEEWRVGKGPF
ncbi:MAG: UvrD-helicase domain-containing protein [Verrucomicrobia bacterium]|nr:UvrD-helicase domain-containing protein [Verrucomicrobiota bacterium]